MRAVALSVPPAISISLIASLTLSSSSFRNSSSSVALFLSSEVMFFGSLATGKPAYLASPEPSIRKSIWFSGVVTEYVFEDLW